MLPVAASRKVSLLEIIFLENTNFTETLKDWWALEVMQMLWVITIAQLEQVSKAAILRKQIINTKWRHLKAWLKDQWPKVEK